MRHQWIMSCCILMVWSRGSFALPRIGVEALADTVGKFQKLELTITVDRQYENPFNPDEVDLTVRFEGPGGRVCTVPAFWSQDYERRKTDQKRDRANGYYPTGVGTWRARFAPMETGSYSAVAVLKDDEGISQSIPVRFTCIDLDSKGFLEISRKDPRFMAFSDGSPFFAIGQDLSFIGGGQYVNLTKAEEIFGKLSENGANFLRIWTCCDDWAMAIESMKSAWGRSWDRKRPIVPMPGSSTRQCVVIGDGDKASINVSPSYPVALRPGTNYVLTGRFMTETAEGLEIQLSSEGRSVYEAGPKEQWKEFRREFTADDDQYWLGSLSLERIGAGKVWLDGLSLKEVDGQTELLWEADVNRPVRGYYNQLDCFILDKVVEAAEQNGLYLMLCLMTRDLYMSHLSDVDSQEYRQAVADAKKFMRYAVARWGYSTSIGAWEYFNEMDPGKPTDRFYDQVGAYLEEIDSYRHLRTTSTWHPSARDCRHERIDIGQAHHYMRPETNEEYKDEVTVLVDKSRFLREHAPNKPVLISEFGLATPKWGLSDNMKRDQNSTHFQTSLWASAFAGSSGTAMFWWWEQLDIQKAYKHYQPLSRYLADVSFVGLEQTCAVTSNDALRVLGYQGKDCVYLWLFNPEATWWNIVIDKIEPKVVQNVTLQVSDLAPGSYTVQWWDTDTGKVIAQELVSVREESLNVPIPTFKRHIACKIRR